jgi:pimeloyl-ACP methyl ester carboxylesterase
MRQFIRLLIAPVLTAALTAVLAVPLRAEIPFQPYVLQGDDGTKVDAERGEIQVRENRTGDNPRTITLRLFRLKSTAAKPGAPIVYLAGGPGGSGLAAARGPRLPLFLALRAFGDVIALEQRGTARSEPSLDCEEPYAVDPSAPLSRASIGKTLTAPIARCAAAWRAKGVDPGAYNTRESAHDLDDLRIALGAPKITLWAISYGTHLALAALKEHPGSIDRLILAGVEPLDGTEKLPSDQQRLLADIARLAAAANVHKDLLGAIDRLGKALDKAPQTVSLVHPVTKQKADMTVGRLDLQVVIAQMLTGPETFGTLPDLVTRLEEGDWTALALSSARFRFGRTPSMLSTAMDCASGASAARRRTIAEEAKVTLLGDAINLPFPDVCATLGIPDLGDAFRAPVRSDVPALLISGTLDGRTSPRNAEQVMKGLTHARHLVIDGAGHSDPLFLASPKILEAMQQFLRGDEVTITRAAAPPVRFLPPRHVVTLSDEALAKFAGEYRIDDKSVRKIVKVGPMLFSIRDNGQPNPIRPSGPSDFFFEGVPVTIHFETNEQGEVTGLVFQGTEGPAQRSARIR